uniref:AlNc14C55G4218 protein n=1 Tax=Albugo laibachii Nc14 TaxID=890382 RepID=F0WC35_9STRA|nr:AlNc14C55G4218 [Albugo laibachii Nc14]|eukprot:CCA18747.1 AlNc14C55G4218 [Albugo laibachii Nc14]
MSLHSFYTLYIPHSEKYRPSKRRHNKEAENDFLRHTTTVFSSDDRNIWEYLFTEDDLFWTIQSSKTKITAAHDGYDRLLHLQADHRGLQSYLIAIQCSRELRKDLFDSRVWKSRLKYHLAIKSTDLPELLPNYDDDFLARIPKTERYPDDPPEFEILNGCSEMKTYVAIATLMQCYVYFVKHNIAVSYQVNGSSVDIVVIPRALLEFLKKVTDGVAISYTGEELYGRKKVYGIHLNVLDALWRRYSPSCPIVAFMSSGSQKLMCGPAKNREYVLAMQALLGLTNLQEWSFKIEAFPTSDALREGSVSQNRNALWISILSVVFPHSDIFIRSEIHTSYTYLNFRS